MTQPIDIAYVEILARTKLFEKQLKDLVNKRVKELEKEFDKATNNIEKDLDQTAKHAEKSFTKIGDDADKSGRRVTSTFRKTFTSIKTGVLDAGRRLKDLFSFGDNNSKKAGANDVDPSFLTRMFSSVAGAVGSLASTLGGFVTSSPLLVLLIALTPAIIAVVAALADLIGLVGLLPAGLSVLLATILPVVVAFQGFGDALSAIMSGDPQKINEALMKLAPSARVVAKEFEKLLPAFKLLRMMSQEAFFEPMAGILTNFGKNVLPAVSIGFSQVASAMGKTLSHIGNFLAMKETGNFLKSVFESAARIATNIGPAIVNFLVGFQDATIALLPSLEKLAGLLFGAVNAFGSWLTTSAKTGKLQEWLDQGLATLHQLWDLIKAVGGLLGTLFDASDEAGRNFIGTLTDVINRLNEFLKTPKGQEEFQHLIDAVKVTGAVLGALFNTLIFIFEANNKISHSLTEMFAWFGKVGKSIGSFFSSLGDFLASLPGKAIDAISSIPTQIGNFIKTSLDTALFEIGVGIGLILSTILEVPDKIALAFTTLKDKVVNAASNLGPSLKEQFIGWLTDLGNLITSKFDEFVAFIASVPDRITALGPKLLQAGKDLIAGLFAGLRQAGSFVGDVAGDIVNALKSGLNHAIDKINSGIAAVDELLPGTLPRIPRLAKGGIVPATPGGRLIVAGEGGKDEIIGPLDKVRDALNVSGDTGGVIFGPGSVVVNFQGVVPTEAEARRTGQAVVAGMAATITRRDIRARVRAQGGKL